MSKWVLFFSSFFIFFSCAHQSESPKAQIIDPPTVEDFTEVVSGDIVDVLIQGQTVRMLVDSQSDTSAISPQLRKSLKLSLLRVAEATLPNKRKIWVDIVKIDNLEYGKQKFNLSPVVVLDMDEAMPNEDDIEGILGRDFLSSL